MKSKLFCLAALFAVSSLAAQNHTPIILAPWFGTSTVVSAPVNLSSAVTATDATGTYGLARVGVYADPSQSWVAGFAYLSPGLQTSIENSISGSQGSSGVYQYIGGTQGVVSTQANSGANVLGQILDPVDVFASAYAYYQNNCGGNLRSGAVVNHTVGGTIPPTASQPSNFQAVCESNYYRFNSNCGGVILVRAYTGGNVFARATAWVGSSTILTQM